MRNSGLCLAGNSFLSNTGFGWSWSVNFPKSNKEQVVSQLARYANDCSLHYSRKTACLIHSFHFCSFVLVLGKSRKKHHHPQLFTVYTKHHSQLHAQHFNTWKNPYRPTMPSYGCYAMIGKLQFSEWSTHVHNTHEHTLLVSLLKQTYIGLHTNTHAVSPPAQGAEQSERTTPQLQSGFLSVRGRVYSQTTPGFFPCRRICEARTQ